jgi:hypothetical protein
MKIERFVKINYFIISDRFQYKEEKKEKNILSSTENNFCPFFVIKKSKQTCNSFKNLIKCIDDDKEDIYRHFIESLKLSPFNKANPTK